MKNVVVSLALLCSCLTPIACDRVSARSSVRARHDPPRSFTTGYWVWRGGWLDRLVDAPDGWAPDVIYVQVNTIGGPMLAGASWPASAPRASKYWVLWRIEPKPDAPLAERLAGEFAVVQAQARLDGRSLEGIQLDYDCPTNDLPRYAEFLEALGQKLPPGTRVSITALLDWFRPGTAIARVLGRVGEFVPQFYDAGKTAQEFGGHVAEPIDPARWAPVFNRFEVPYRIGISSFGRISTAARGTRAVLADSRLLDLLSDDGLEAIGTPPLPTGEITLKLRVKRPKVIYDLVAGDTIDVVLPTSESVGKAYEAARQMRGFCEGVAIFRWPAQNETTVLSPGTVSRAVAGGAAGAIGPRVSREPGDCASANCSDLYVEPAEPISSAAAVYTIRASCAVDYFLPTPRLAVQAALAPGRRIVVKLPAYLGGSHLYVGRAVSHCRADFTIERTR